MRNEKLLHAIGDIDDNLVQESAVKETVIRPKKQWLMPFAACIALILIIGGGYFITKPALPHITMTPPAADSPSGMRKFLIYNDMRYAFLDNGATVQFENLEVGENVGVILYDVTVDPKRYAKENFAASFAVGGKIYEIPTYNPDFRIAVMLDDATYLCERVDFVLDQEMDLQEYFKTADLFNLVKSIDVYDHARRTLLKTLEKNDIATILDGVAASVPAQLTGEDYQNIGNAQKQGESFSMHCNLDDGTVFKFYLIPELGIAMVGDNRYQISEDFKNTCLDLLGGLQQKALPMQ